MTSPHARNINKPYGSGITVARLREALEGLDPNTEVILATDRQGEYEFFPLRKIKTHYVRIFWGSSVKWDEVSVGRDNKTTNQEFGHAGPVIILGVCHRAGW